LQNLTTSSPLPHNLISSNFTAPAEGGRKKKLLPKKHNEIPPCNNKKFDQLPPRDKTEFSQARKVATGGERSEQRNGNPLGPTLGLGLENRSRVRSQQKIIRNFDFFSKKIG
jgi:hypothetical protein